MKRIIPLVALGAVLFAVAAAPVQATAAPPSLPTPVAINDNGAYVVLGKPPGSGPLDFRYGWRTSGLFEAPPVGYWLGLYDKTNSHYVWASDNPLPLPVPTPDGASSLESADFRFLDETANLSPGVYLINFFVRYQYEPADNVAVISLEFKVP